jgi:hypothetical protein
MGTTWRIAPNDTLDFEVSWASWLPQGDSITDSTWTVGDGLTLGDTFFTGTTTTVWVSAAVEGVTVTGVNEITTAAGRVASDTFIWRVQPR